MKMLLVSRIDSGEALSFTRQLGSDLIARGHEVIFEEETAGSMGVSGAALASAPADLVVVIGGDGTILRSVQRMERQIPLVGINWGEVGFLADLEPKKALSFLSGISGTVNAEPRMRLALSREGLLLGEALNEALIITTRPAKMLRFSILVDGVVAEQFRADGLLISTPTGSTAYAMSAGGPIVDPRIEGIVLVPLAPYMLSSRPHVISSDRHIEIRLESAKPADLVIDGQRTVELGTDNIIEVKKSVQPALLVDAGQNFFAKVDRKLRRL
ncbi:MAG: NAD(+)/NADH kinase [Methanoregula sp.]|nr:MAG: NAD(+)/NADH kinase [Methanoregula sp.]